ncbi:MAG: ATP-binding cassette domain-containing protein [Planctomycetes bacterium]|nr:ATP-binding cassette domain-containing protein [Planctomycetota bacterium]
MISVSNLTKYYADNLALDRLSFEVEAGEIVGFLGPNGAGKSTTMKIITCFLPPSAGRVTVAGYDIIEEPMQVRRRIGYMPENVPLYGEMRVHEYLSFRAEIKDVKRSQRKKRVDEVIERCWLEGVRKQTIATLSKGYRQRVGLADALVADPDILILDEPTIGLDPNQVRQVRSLIHQLGRDHTVLLCTHILPEVEMICDRVVIINNGRIAAEDSLEGLRSGGREHVEYYVEVKGPPEKVEEALLGVEGVQDLRRQRAHETDEGVVAFVFKAARGSTSPEAAASTIVAGGWGLREMKRKERTLEDVFVEIVSKE